MFASILLSMREGLEAALIIGIVLSVLVKLDQFKARRKVWVGVGLGILASVIAALLLNLFGLQFEGRGEQIFEGVTMLLAAGILTWMIFWMKTTARNLQQKIESESEAAVSGSKPGALIALAFLAVFREGVELALFLFAVRFNASPFQTLVGTLLGLTTAVVLGWLVYSSTRRLNLHRFFTVTNILLLVFAAGLVGLGVHELNEAGIIPSIIDPVWNINPILNENSQVGLILKALLGYNGNPSLSEVIAYGLYVIFVGGYLLTQKRVFTRKSVQ